MKEKIIGCDEDPIKEARSRGSHTVGDEVAIVVFPERGGDRPEVCVIGKKS